MPSQTLKDCGIAIAGKGFTIAFAESATAGRMAAEFSLLAESGKILKGGIVCYDASIKEDILNIPKEFVEKYTPESAEVTEALADRIGKLIESDIQVAVTGLTTPGGSENAEKPVGTMFIHIVVNGKSLPIRHVFTGAPEEIVLQTIDHAAQIILQELR
jgi:nicotinamide-nucleotide amidase